MRRPPDFFEVRLDALAPVADEIEKTIAKLGAPLILTARHPAEGGANSLRASARRNLLERFLPHAAYVDVELRARRECAVVLDSAKSRRVRTILSFHDFGRTPSTTVLLDKASAAIANGADLFKLATRVDNEAQLARLLAFVERAQREIPIAAMGIGRLGRAARLELLRRGSALNYGYLTAPQAEGQLSVSELQRLLGRRG